MSSTLLSTKLFIPKPPPSLVSRPRLVDKLNTAINQGCGLIVLSAPAGCGKTTLLSEWVDLQKTDKNTRFSWISLDEGDNDSALFLSYLLAAIQTVIPHFGEEFHIGLQSQNPAQMEALMTLMINELSGLTHRLILVLDDYHLIHTQKVHSALAFFLDHRPPNFHLVIAARADPLLPMALMRSRGMMTEFRLNDLRFTNAEVASYVALLLGHPFSEADIRALTLRTEGWAAGLQMAAASMRESEDISAFIRDFSGSNRFILDYLVEQVLEQQPRFVQEFLFKSSILERLCASLCDTLLDIRLTTEDIKSLGLPDNINAGYSASQIILEYLERSNLFIVPLDDRRCWYRYHHLFTDLLGQRLHQLYPQAIPELHSCAAGWFAQNGFMAEAIDHALEGKDFETAANWVEEVVEKTMMRSEVVTFLNWIEKLPEPLIKNRPLLCINHAWAMLLNGYPGEMVEARLEQLDQSADLFTGKTLALRSYLAIFRGQYSQAIAFAKQALDLLSEEDSFFRSLSAMVLGAALYAEGDKNAGEQAIEMATRLSLGYGNVLIRVFVLVYLAENYRKQGQLHKAYTLYQQALEHTTPEKGKKLPIAGRVLLGMGEILREWNDPRAEEYLLEGIDLSGQWGTVTAISGYFSLSHIFMAKNDWVKANDMLQKARQLAYYSDITEIDDLMVDIFQVRFWIEQGNLSAAREWCKKEGLYQNIDIAEMEKKDDFIAFHMRKYEYPIVMRLWMMEGRFAEAQAFLEDLLIKLENWERPILVIETHILLALALFRQHKIEPAINQLEIALSLAEPEGFMRTFLNEGESLHALLKLTVANLKAESLRAYGQRLLQAFSSGGYQSKKGEISEKSGVSIETLSERELDVLRLLASSLSAQEMAAELVVSVHTVRSHIKNIYSKLNVHNRYGAVERGKELGII